MGRCRVLIADDDRDARDTLAMLLAEDGFEAATAENGRRALDQLECGVPDVVVLDLSMPVLDGYGFLDEVRKNARWSRIPVVVTTGNPGCDRERMGVFAVLRKPIDVDELERLLRRAVPHA